MPSVIKLYEPEDIPSLSPGIEAKDITLWTRLVDSEYERCSKEYPDNVIMCGQKAIVFANQRLADKNKVDSVVSEIDMSVSMGNISIKHLINNNEGNASIGRWDFTSTGETIEVNGVEYIKGKRQKAMPEIGTYWGPWHGYVVLTRPFYDAIVNNFNSKKSGDRPVYIDKLHEEKKSYGLVTEVSWDQSGLYFTPLWNKAGYKLVKNGGYMAFSVTIMKELNTKTKESSYPVLGPITLCNDPFFMNIGQIQLNKENHASEGDEISADNIGLQYPDSSDRKIDRELFMKETPDTEQILTAEIVEDMISKKVDEIGNMFTSRLNEMYTKMTDLIGQFENDNRNDEVPVTTNPAEPIDDMAAQENVVLRKGLEDANLRLEAMEKKYREVEEATAKKAREDFIDKYSDRITEATRGPIMEIYDTDPDKAIKLMDTLQPVAPRKAVGTSDFVADPILTPEIQKVAKELGIAPDKAIEYYNNIKKADRQWGVSYKTQKDK